MRIVLALAAASACLVAGQALAAQPAPRTAEQAKVSLTQVDFRDKVAVDRVYGQLRRAARDVCDSRISDRTIREADQACAREALDRSVAQLSRPMLTARHDQAGPAFARGWN